MMFRYRIHSHRQKLDDFRYNRPILHLFQDWNLLEIEKIRFMISYM